MEVSGFGNFSDGNFGNYSFGNWTALSNNLNVSGVEWNIVVAGGLANISLHFILFFVSLLFRTEKLYDLTGAISFLVIGVYSFLHARSRHSTDDLRPFICTFLSFFWALRISIYAFVIALTRIEKSSARFHKVKNDAFRFFLFWGAQAVWVVVTSLPVSLVNATKPTEVIPIMTPTDWIGVTLWMIGLTIECIADCQKMYLKINIEDSDKWLSTGLWRFVRYPNQSGEILVWIGIFLTSFSSLSQQRNLMLIALASPIVVILNIVFLSIPLLERRANSRWGTDPNYQAYKRGTSELVPWKFSSSSARASNRNANSNNSNNKAKAQ